MGSQWTSGWRSYPRSVIRDRVVEDGKADILQIIARVHTPRQAIQSLIVRLLHDIGKTHPQALIYPLTVAAKSNVPARKAVALSIMFKMRDHSEAIVEQVCQLFLHCIATCRTALLLVASFHCAPHCRRPSISANKDLNTYIQAELVSTELIRAAILWHEMWYDGLEEASKFYFADSNIPGMYSVLAPLHEMVERVSVSLMLGTNHWNGIMVAY